jgi:hypothetical protein
LLGFAIANHSAPVKRTTHPFFYVGISFHGKRGALSVLVRRHSKRTAFIQLLRKGGKIMKKITAIIAVLAVAAFFVVGCQQQKPAASATASAVTSTVTSTATATVPAAPVKK